MTPHVIVFGELSPRARARYTRFLLDNRVQFRKRESDGRYCANVRLTLPELSGTPIVDDSAAAELLGEEKDAAVAPAVATEDKSENATPAIPARFQRLANLVALIGERKVKAGGGTTQPYVRETRLIRLLNEIYDARADESAAYGSTSTDGSVVSSFARFVRHCLTNRFGLRKIVDLQCWELVEGLISLHHRPDVELFVSFIEGKYPDWTLAFFLSARSHVQRLLSGSMYRPTLHKSTGSAGQRASKRRSAASLLSSAAAQWLSKSQLETLTPLVFGTKTDTLHIEFAHAVRALVASDPATRTANRALTVSEFLFVATETYHKADGVDLHRSNAQGGNDGSMTPASVASSASSTGAVALAFEEPARADDVQMRLSSLLERAKRRQQQRQMGLSDA